MTDATINKIASKASAIQDVKKTNQIGGINEYTATCIVAYKGNEKEFKVITWQKEEDEAAATLNIEKQKAAFEILKYQWKI